MSYTPKHAKPESAKGGDLGRDHEAFGLTQASTGRHARTAGKARRTARTGRA